MATVEEPGSGDRIIAVEVAADGRTVRYVEEPDKEDPGVEQVPFDPLKLGVRVGEVVRQGNAADRTVRITVLRRRVRRGEMTGRRVTFRHEWDPALVYNGEIRHSSTSAGGHLRAGAGLLRRDDGRTPPRGSLLKGDVMTEVRPQKVNAKGEASPDEWLPLKQYQGVALHRRLQAAHARQFDLQGQPGRGDHGSDRTAAAGPILAGGRPGLRSSRSTREPRWRTTRGKPWRWGAHRTWRTVKVIYQTLYATIFRQISAKTMSGPLSIANASYKIAGHDVWQFIIFIGLININLAVVNFLPIPLLDGGHMVFLIYEKVRGKPAPEKLQEYPCGLGWRSSCC